MNKYANESPMHHFCSHILGQIQILPVKYLPGPFSRKMTLDSGKKLEPLITISSPPLTRQLVRLNFSTCGNSCAERWAGRVGGKNEGAHVKSLGFKITTDPLVSTKDLNK